MEKLLIHYTLNGRPQEEYVDPRWSLTELLRDGQQPQHGVKQGCGVGECGACTVLIDDEPFNSCIYLAVWADGKSVRTVESLAAPDGTLNDLQQAFVDEAAVQCGFCTPGFLMSATAIVESGQPYTRQQIRRQLSGNFCRCTGYENIINAVEKVLQAHLSAPQKY